MELGLIPTLISHPSLTGCVKSGLGCSGFCIFFSMIFTTPLFSEPRSVYGVAQSVDTPVVTGDSGELVS